MCKESAFVATYLNGAKCKMQICRCAGQEAQASDDSGNECEDLLTSSLATAHDSAEIGADLVRPSVNQVQPLILPKRIHSAASLVNGTSSRVRLAASQADATRDPMSSPRHGAIVKAEVQVGRAAVPHDQAHWQDDYATNWDRVGMGRNASSSDAAAAAMQQVSCPSGLHDESDAKPSKSKAWACKLCTFAANPSHSIRCEVCETVRGSTLQDYKPPAAAAPDTFSDRQTQEMPVAPAVQISSTQNKRQTSKQQQRSIAGFLGPGLNSKTTQVGASGAHADASSCENEGDMVESPLQLPNASVWTRVDFHTEVRWQCAKCKCWFQSGQKAEHDDYHLALDLQKQSAAVHTSRIARHLKRQKL